MIFATIIALLSIACSNSGLSDEPEKKDYITEETGFSYYKITKGSKQGIMSADNDKIIVPVLFDSVIHRAQTSGKDIGLAPMDWFIAYRDNIAQLYSKLGEIIISDEFGFESISPHLFRTSVYESLWFRVSKDGEMGLCNSRGKLIVPCRFKSIYKKDIPDCNIDGSKKTQNQNIYQDAVIFCTDNNNYKSVYNTEGMIVIGSGRFVEIDALYSVGTYYFICKDESTGYRSVFTKNGKFLFEDDAFAIEQRVTSSGNMVFLSMLNDCNERIIRDKYGEWLFRGDRDNVDEYIYNN